MFNGKPLICVSASSNNRETLFDGKARNITNPKSYTHAVAVAGGIPVLACEEMAETMAALCDGLVLTGGPDINPKWFHQEDYKADLFYDDVRDEYEFALFEAFKAAGKPIFGVCRGEQLINIALGGDLIQDLVTMEGYVHMNHDIRHRCFAEKGSILNNLFGDEFRVNSTHHQAVGKVAPGLKVTARSIEGIVEGYEHESLPIFATQFHPERLSNEYWDGRTPDMQPLWNYFINFVKEHGEK